MRLKAEDLGSMKYGQHSFKAYELVFHHPAEHTFGHDAKHYDFEVQVLGRDTAGTLFGVILLFEKSATKGSALFDALGLGGAAKNVPTVTQQGSE